MRHESAVQCLLILILSSLVGAPSAGAQERPVSSDATLLALSDVVITGRVAGVATGWDTIADAPYTYVTIDVGEVIKGWVFERQIILKQLGGNVDGVELSIGGQARFDRGENVLLFLSVRPRDATLMTTALAQGKWAIAAGPLGLQARQEELPAHVRPLENLLASLRDLAGPDRFKPSAKHIVTAPREAAGASEATASAGFAFSGARWHEADAGVPVFVDSQAGGQPGLAGGGFDEIQRAMAAWSNGGGSIRLAVGSPRSARCFGTYEANGRISVSFADPCGEMATGGPYGGVGFAAIGGMYRVGGDDRVINGRTFSKGVSGMVVTNMSRFGDLTNASCFQAVLTHELGHAIGFQHSADSTAVMYPSVPCGRTLAADDLAGLQQIYPSASAGPIPGPPSNLMANAVGTTATLTWTAPANVVPTSYTIEVGSASGLADLTALSTGNTATAFSTAPVASGTYYVRVRASNGAGVSSPSNEATLVVASGCSRAPAPTGLRVASNTAGTVVLSWNASGGNPTSYVVEAGSTPGAADLANSNLGSAATTLTAHGVGFGTYFVRIRAQDTCGVGPASNELVVVVP